MITKYYKVNASGTFFLEDYLDLKYDSINKVLKVFDRIKKRWGFIDINTGMVIGKCKYLNEPIYSEGVAPVKGDNMLYQFIDIHGNIVIKNKYLKAHQFNKNKALVYGLKGYVGYIDKQGNELISYNAATEFSENIASIIEQDGKKRCIDENYNILFDCSNYYGLPVFSENLACVENKLYGFIDKSGNEIAGSFKYYRARNFKNGLAAVCNKEGKWGFINKNLELVIDYQFNWVSDFETDGLSIIKNDYNHFGLIDKLGNFKTGYNYLEIGPLHEKCRKVRDLNNLVGYLKENTCEKMIPCMYMDISNFSNGIAIARNIQGLSGLINKENKTVLFFTYKDIYQVADNLYRAKSLANRFVLFDNNGKLVDDKHIFLFHDKDKMERFIRRVEKNNGIIHNIEYCAEVKIDKSSFCISTHSEKVRDKLIEEIISLMYDGKNVKKYIKK
jgi:hypothetical protein